MTDSIWICFVVLTLVLFVPILCKRLRFPQIAGLIVTGVLIGPGVLNILQVTPEIQFFSRMGLLFIMFFAGLGIDLEEMKRNKVWGIIFGILTFAVPWALCYFSCVWLLKLPRPDIGHTGMYHGFTHPYIISYHKPIRTGPTQERDHISCGCPGCHSTGSDSLCGDDVHPRRC